MVTGDELQRYLHLHMPLSVAMGVEVVEVNSKSVSLSAPLALNVNHQSTVFGGSASTLAILAAWSSMHVRLGALRETVTVVIQNQSVRYLVPMRQDFQAVSHPVDDTNWTRFLDVLARHGKARVSVDCDLICEGIVAATFSGVFVALKSEG